MNSRIYLIAALVVIVVLLIVMLLLKSDPEPEPEKPKFNVIGVSMSKKDETPGKTENYTSEELSKLSEQVEFTYKFSVEGGADFMSLIKCTRVHDGITDQQTITPPFVANQVYTLKFSAKPGESVIGTHIFKLSYDSDVFGLDNLVDSQQSTINPEQLSRVIDNDELVSLELIIQFDDNNNELTTSIDKTRVIIKSNGKDIFDREEIYLSPLVDTDGGVCIKKMSNGENIAAGGKFPTEISECVPLYFSKYEGKRLISTSSNPESPNAKFLNVVDDILSFEQLNSGPIDNKLFSVKFGEPFADWRLEENVDYPYNDVFSMKGSKETCLERCEEMSNCKLVAFGSNNNCWGKSAAENKLIRPGSITYFKP